MSKEHFNGSSINKSAIALRLLPLAMLVVIGAYLMFYDKTLKVADPYPWKAKGFGIGIIFIAGGEMIAFEQRLRFNTPPSPASSTKSNNSNVDVVSGMIVLAIFGGYMLSKNF